MLRWEQSGPHCLLRNQTPPLVRFFLLPFLRHSSLLSMSLLFENFLSLPSFCPLERELGGVTPFSPKFLNFYISRAKRERKDRRKFARNFSTNFLIISRGFRYYFGSKISLASKTVQTFHDQSFSGAREGQSFRMLRQCISGERSRRHMHERLNMIKLTIIAAAPTVAYSNGSVATSVSQYPN